MPGTRRHGSVAPNRWPSDRGKRREELWCSVNVILGSASRRGGRARRGIGISRGVLARSVVASSERFGNGATESRV